VSTNNNLTTIELPENIIDVILDNNKLTSITARKPLTKIIGLSIQDNKFEKFDLLLPNSMGHFNIQGNNNIKIKYIDFVFICDEYDNVRSLIDGDYKYILANGALMSEYVRHQVAQRAYTGQKYIDIAKFY
jgi:hypothetical protein